MYNQSVKCNKAASLVFVFLFGFFGLHKFYEGKVATGVIYIVLNIVSFLFTLPFVFLSFFLGKLGFILLCIGLVGFLTLAILCFVDLIKIAKQQEYYSS